MFLTNRLNSHFLPTQQQRSSTYARRRLHTAAQCQSDPTTSKTYAAHDLRGSAASPILAPLKYLRTFYQSLFDMAALIPTHISLAIEAPTTESLIHYFAV
ncbi:hypothetical protein M0802_006488 [Mischocyttarus mexicanus]|nr:hypothetical protein M0802_006488 [Mischocyttarus mexicanus]